jgi:hypothetical protein
MSATNDGNLVAKMRSQQLFRVTHELREKGWYFERKSYTGMGIPLIFPKPAFGYVQYSVVQFLSLYTNRTQTRTYHSPTPRQPS